MTSYACFFSDDLFKAYYNFLDILVIITQYLLVLQDCPICTIPIIIKVLIYIYYLILFIFCIYILHFTFSFITLIKNCKRDLIIPTCCEFYMKHF